MKQSIRTKLLIVISIILLALIMGGVAKAFNSDAAHDYREAVISASKADGVDLGVKSTKNLMPILTVVFSVSIAGVILIFAGLHLRNDQAKKWPYIVLIVIASLGLLIALIDISVLHSRNGHTFKLEDKVKTDGLVYVKKFWPEYETKITVSRYLILARNIIILAASIYGLVIAAKSIKNNKKPQAVEPEVIEETQ